jgi:hypothetical protein
MIWLFFYSAVLLFVQSPFGKEAKKWLGYPLYIQGTMLTTGSARARGAMGNMKRGISLTVGSDRHIPWACFLSIVGVWRIHTAKQDRCCRSGSWDMNISWVGLVFWFFLHVDPRIYDGYETDGVKGEGGGGHFGGMGEELVTGFLGVLGRKGGFYMRVMDSWHLQAARQCKIQRL